MMPIMRVCKKCLTTDLRPNASFNDDGVCIACQYSSISKVKSSKIKLESLIKKLNQTRKKTKKTSQYDCIVGVSGGKDSTRQAHWVRDRLGLNPLLVCAAYPPLQMSEIGAKNLSNLLSMGFNLIALTPAPQTSAKLSLKSFELFGNVCKSTEMALFSTVPRIAIDNGINMIFWGENPALQMGDSAALGNDEYDGNNLRKINTLTQGGSDWIHENIDKFYKYHHYYYPDEILFDRKKISIFYLGAAWDDWSNKSNSIYAALNGLTLRPNEESVTGDISNASMLDEEFTNINMMLKFFKFGFGRATDLVCEMIRNGSITRAEGITIVEQYDGICDDSIIEKYCAYVGISIDRFWDIARHWTNKDIFDVTSQKPIKQFKVGFNFYA
ncbi:N-acetyl sugar amidotransferase [Synechococcus sp. AH-707-M23]|nr:N-acetyl sugar amidotransferase [Synechococcus sp. AH-707-M23]